jgi:hypothetical protein
METANDNALNKVISLFGANDTGRGGLCPGCGHHSITIDNKKGKVLAWCAAECGAQDAINAKVRELLGPEKPLTLSTWCAWKKLPEHWVRDFALVHERVFVSKDGKPHKGRTLCFPYIGLPEVREWVDGEGTKHTTRTRHEGGFKFRPYKHKKGFWGEYTGPMLYGFNLLPYYEAHGIELNTVVLVEGESDTITLAYNGIPTLGVPGAPNGWRDEFAKVPVLAAARRILFIEEPDEASAKLTKKIAASFEPGKVWRVKLPVKDASDLWTRNPKEFATEWQRAVSAAASVIPTNDTTAVEGERHYMLTRMSERTPKALEWFWPGKIPKNKVAMFAGEPGAAKSLVTCSLAALQSTGSCLPGEVMPSLNVAEVAMLYCEDDTDDTVLPRLIASGADLTRIHELKVKRIAQDGTEEERHLALDTDLAILRECLRENPKIRLVTIDPITNYTGAAKITDEKAMRDVLTPLKELASEREVTIILVAHLNKRSDVNALNRVLGAVAMTGVARSAWLFAADEDAPDDGFDHMLMLHGKLNVGRKAKQSLKYSIKTKDIAELPPEADAVPYIEWNGESEQTAEDVLDTSSGKKSEKAGKRQEGVAFLRSMLGGGPRLADEVNNAAAARSISEATLRRAKKDLKVQSEKERGTPNGRIYWRLAGDGRLPMSSNDEQYC